jgi:acetyltransferase-like isoleucine patch superfamily enzyme
LPFTSAASLDISDEPEEIHIGNNVVIGANSLVTKDIPDNYLAFGNPCHPIRLIIENNSKKYIL